MVIGILVFNKLVSRDGILDKKLKHRAGYDSTSLLVPAFSFLLLKSCKNIHTVCFELLYIWRFRPPFFCHWKEITGINIKRSDLSRERHGFVFLWQNQSKMKKPHTHAHTLAASVVDNMTVGDFKVELVALSIVCHDVVSMSHRQMSEPHTGLTLKCAKCGVVSTTALSATTASNAM